MTDTKTPQAPREEEKLLEELEKQMATDHRRECPKGIWKAQKYLERLERFYMGSIPTLISHIHSLRFKLEASEAQNKKMKESQKELLKSLKIIQLKVDGVNSLLSSHPTL